MLRLDRQRWLVLVAMTGSLSMIMVDQTVVTVALPSMARELPLSASGEQWVVNAYGLATAGLVVFGGKLGDRVGGVTTFRVGVALFALSSAACGLAPRGSHGEVWIITARALQGAGAALMMPVSAVIVMRSFGPRERGQAMALYAGLGQMFLAVGPLLGGVLTQEVSWRAVFWLNLPIGAAALVMVARARPDDSRQPGTRIRLGSAALLTVGLAGVVLPIQQASRWSWRSALTLGMLACGVAVLVAFVVVQLHDREPFLQVRLLTRRPFLANVVVAALVQFGLLAVVLYGALYLQDLLRLSPIGTGFAVLPLIVALTVAAQLGGRWYDRAGVRPAVLSGIGFSAVGVALWTAVLPRLSYPWQLPGMVLTGFGIGLVTAPTNTDALAQVAAELRSQASGVVQTARQLGGTLGVAGIGAVVLSIEHRGTSAPSPQHAADAITVGFAAATVMFAVTLVAGWRLLPAGRPAAEPPTTWPITPVAPGHPSP